MKKLLILLLPIMILSWCSLLGKQTEDPNILIQNLSEKEGWKFTTDCIINWFYTDIDKRITSESCYKTEIRIYPTTNFWFTEFGNILMDSIIPIKKYLEKNWFKKNIDNVADASLLSDWSRYFEWYENWATKCTIVGYVDGVDTTQWLNRNYISMNITCSNKIDTQKTLQKKLLETMNWWDYPYMSYKEFWWVYIDKTSGNFLHGSRASWLPWWTEVIFERKWDNFELIYEWNSGITCSVVQEYNIPTYIYWECY